ncbi:MAG: hypothetical protein MJ010_06700 [Paludibacteraceae bacterium]|nr:hypothetical protein [Paludibacteraceae bacterium]
MEDFDDIINLPHHTSKVHTPISREARAAQFASFAALGRLNDKENPDAR